jgi:hypothetical protein
MKKLFWIIASLIWIISASLLLIATTNLFPGNPLKEYTLIIGLGLIFVSGVIGSVYRRLYK